MSIYISDPFVAPVVIRAYRKRRPYKRKATYAPAPERGPAYADFFAPTSLAVLKVAS